MVENQAYLFLVFSLTGVVLGVLFDFFRVLRKTFKTGDFVTYIEDILFWILTGFSILYFIFIFNNGEIRFFMFVAIGIGVILYMKIFSSIFIKINVNIINFFKKVFSIIIIVPIRFIKKIFFKPISFIFINIRNLYKKTYKKIENNVKN